jgi:hypothetical protein
LRRVRYGGIPIDAVRDARSTSKEPWTVSATAAAEWLHNEMGTIRARRQEGQPFRVVIVAEADGTVDFIEELADGFGVGVHSGSGSVPLSLVIDVASDAVRH